MAFSSRFFDKHIHFGGGGSDCGADIAERHTSNGEKPHIAVDFDRMPSRSRCLYRSAGFARTMLWGLCRSRRLQCKSEAAQCDCAPALTACPLQCSGRNRHRHNKARGANVAIEHEADTIEAAVTVCGAARLEGVPGRAVVGLGPFSIRLKRHLAPFLSGTFGRQVAPQQPVRQHFKLGRHVCEIGDTAVGRKLGGLALAGSTCAISFSATSCCSSGWLPFSFFAASSGTKLSSVICSCAFAASAPASHSERVTASA